MLDISRNSSSSNFSSTLLKKVESKNNNLNIIPIKNENVSKYKNAFDILNNMNNHKYTMKYIEENKLKNKNIENDIANNNKNNSPINLNNNKFKNYNRSSSYLNKTNNNIKNEKCDKHKNRSMKKNNNNNIKFIIKDKEKIKDNNNNIHEYKINNLSSSYNNNFTNIKTNKIVFIDLKDNDNNFLKNDLTNENRNENNRYSRNINQNVGEEVNDNLIFNSGVNPNITNKHSKNLRSSNNNIKGSSNNKINTNKKSNINNNNINNNNLNNNNNNNNSINNNNNINNNADDKIILRNSNSKNINKNKNKFLNLTIQKLEKNNSENNQNNFTILEDKEGKEILGSKNSPKNRKIEGLTDKENAYYILSKSPVLRLCERMIFSRSSLALRNILPKETIINEHYIILKNKIDELEKKIILCDKILNTPFIASKTADITLNFITSLQEIEFREYPILLSSEEEKKYYLNYLKILYHLLEEEIEVNNNENNTVDQNNMILNLRKDLYSKINKKGFKSLRDYLYNVFITKKDYIKEIPKIVKINYLVSQVNNMFEIHNSLKICKFISFTLYLVREIVKFGNNIKSSVELKIKAKNLIDIINKKIKKYNNINKK